VVAIPTGRAEVKLGPLAALGDADVYASERWLLIRALGPFANAREALERLHEAWLAGMRAVPSPSRRLRAHLRDNEANLCGALRRSGGDCPRAGAVP
jgi:hypothetical protein